MARLQGFPADWTITGRKTAAYRQVALVKTAVFSAQDGDGAMYTVSVWSRGGLNSFDLMHNTVERVRGSAAIKKRKEVFADGYHGIEVEIEGADPKERMRYRVHVCEGNVYEIQLVCKALFTYSDAADKFLASFHYVR